MDEICSRQRAVKISRQMRHVQMIRSFQSDQMQISNIEKCVPKVCDEMHWCPSYFWATMHMKTFCLKSTWDKSAFFTGSLTTLIINTGASFKIGGVQIHAPSDGFLWVIEADLEGRAFVDCMRRKRYWRRKYVIDAVFCTPPIRSKRMCLAMLQFFFFFGACR